MTMLSNKNTYLLLIGMQNGRNTLGDTFGSFLPCDPAIVLSDIYSTDLKMYVYT